MLNMLNMHEISCSSIHIITKEKYKKSYGYDAIKLPTTDSTLYDNSISWYVNITITTITVLTFTTLRQRWWRRSSQHLNNRIKTTHVAYEWIKSTPARVENGSRGHRVGWGHGHYVRPGR